jgi:DNA polymerase I
MTDSTTTDSTTTGDGDSDPTQTGQPARRYLLLDGNSLTYRAFFALPTDMATASGQVTNAVFGFTSMLAYVLKEQRPDGVLVAFDRPEPTFRHEAEPEYKAQREAAPDILRQQMGLVREVLDALGIQAVDAPGWEADDLIASACARLVERGDEVVIVTGDRDSYQLVSDPHVRVLYNKRGVSDYALYDEAGIAERTGVTPQLYPQYAALRGDSSDNLPGVPGVGEKTAAKLINTYGGLDGIFAHVDEQTPKLRASLAEHEERVRKNHELMVLRRDAPIDDVDFDDLAVTPDVDKVHRLFDFLEFRTLADRLADAIGSSMGPADTTPRDELVPEITPIEGAAAAASLLAGLDVLDLAGSWTGEPGRSPLVGIAVVTDAERAEVAWIPAELCADEGVRKELAAHESVRSHNIKPLMRSLLSMGVDVCGLRLDTAIAAYLIDPAESRYALGDLIERFTRFAAPVDATTTGQLDLDGTSVDDVTRAARDALAVGHVSEPITSSLRAHGVAELYESIENPLVRVLAKMEHVGVAVDETALRAINARLSDEVQQLTAELRRVAGRDDLNLNSPVQLRELLYTERGLVPVKKTKTGYSTDAATLEKAPRPVARVHRAAAAPPRGREAPRHLRRGSVARDRVRRPHPRHVQPDRGAHRSPQLRSAEPPQHPGPQRRWVASSAPHSSRARDTSCSWPTTTRSSCAASHTWQKTRASSPRSPATGHPQRHRVAGVRSGAGRGHVDQRSKAKMVSYGLAYGMEAYGLGQRLNIPTDEAAGILDAYFEAFPNVKDYMDRTVAEARERGYTETLFGRRRPIPELLDPNFRIRQAGERQAMNAGIQGLAADIFKVAVSGSTRRSRHATARAGWCCRCTTRCSSRWPPPNATRWARWWST